MQNRRPSPLLRQALTVLLAATGILAGTSARSQQPSPTPTPPPGGQPVWRCELPGGIYEVALRAIVSVSTHEYIVDGTARVTEVNIDTNGSMTVRFYHLEPVTATSPFGIGQATLDKAQELTKEALDRSGQSEVWKRVVKSYPTTTHARTIEYRVESKGQLQKLFESAETAFRFGRNTTFKLP